MLQAMSKLTTKSDVLRVVVTLLVCLALWGIIEAFVQFGRGRLLLPVILGVILVAVAAMTANGVRMRAGKLMQGRCPNSLCHGTVHHSDLVPKGMLVCPTCKSRWPEVPGIKFRATGREHA